MHTEELHDLYSSPNIICVITSRRIAKAGHVARREESERKIVFVGRTLGRLRYRKENDIKMDIQEREWGVWMGFFWLRTETSDGLL